MNVEEAYKHWANQYDTNLNKTRDLEARSLRENLNEIQFQNCLEIGCGTGKNTEWLITKGEDILSIDLSEEMLQIAKQKISNENVTFLKFDINNEWNFTNQKFDLIVCSLVLEHIENIERIFQLMNQHLLPGGTIYIGEFHPFKQYSGSKPRFENENGEQEVSTFVHNVSEYAQLAKANNLKLIDINEYFDDDNSLPRILSLILKK